VSRRSVLTTTFMFMMLGLTAPLYAEEPAAAAARVDLVRWSIITAGFALAIASAFGTLAQSRGLSAAAEGIARNPSAAPDIRFALILGLVLIESLVIYVLLISLILFFVQPFGA
jgi:F-type H+-transporting ATPase subunit c